MPVPQQSQCLWVLMSALQTGCFHRAALMGTNCSPQPSNPRYLEMFGSLVSQLQVLHECQTHAAIKQPKWVKPLWCRGRWLKGKYGEAWQIVWITLTQSHDGKCHVLMMVEATTGGVQTHPVPHGTT